MKNLSYVIILLLFITGCYHAQITTGQQPSTQVIDTPFAHSFIYGLVPPNIVNVANECTNGVAIVETRLSFVNQLVSAITFGIYTPMHITVTCAASRTVSDSMDHIRVDKEASDEEMLEAIGIASDITFMSRQPVAVYFE